MRLVIDCFKMVKGKGKSIGIYNYTINLVHYLAETKRDEDTLIVFGNESNRNSYQHANVQFVCVEKYNPLNKFHLLWWELFGVSFLLKKIDADCVIYPRGFSALLHPVKDIVVVHDLIPFFYHENYKNYFPKLENAYIMTRLKQSIKSSSHVVTISEASSKSIQNYLGVKRDKVTIIYHGCNDLDYSPVRPTDSEDYVCAITSDFPHKNARTIIDGYVRYCEMVDSPSDLIIVGLEDIEQYVIPGHIKCNIKCIKYIREEKDFFDIIANSKLLMFLSLIEGFGAPPIEAMQLGVPVLCSDIEALTEITGGAAEYVNPLDSEEVAFALERVLKDKRRLSELISLGYKNIKRFDWYEQAEKYWRLVLDENRD